MKYEITENEASSLKDFIEYNFLDSIRNDPDTDSLLYVWNILRVYDRIGGFESFIDYEPYNK
ncbi:MAG: hypothetical protein IJH55_02705 [Romboutsia sp.]|nr:hypothetical protein [Romboutsia sp.]